MTEHLHDDALALYYYGEPEGQPEAHLEVCEECHARYQRLKQVLNSVDALPVPERPADYEERLWTKVAPSLVVRRRNWMATPFFRIAAVGTCLAVVAFVALRPEPEKPQDREGVLAVAMEEHLERAQLILAEVSNDESRASIDFERGTAEELLESNRLYRQAALYSDDRETAEILDGLERALAEIAHTPENASPEELQGLRQGIRGQGILTQVRDFETRLRTQL